MESIHKELLIIKNLVESRQEPSILHFTDDNVFYTQQRLQEICHTIIKSQIQLPWTGFMRAATLYNSDIELLKRTNLLMAIMGIESGDPGILQAMNKKQDLEHVKKAIELLDQNRISLITSFIVGFPGETRETLYNTASFINNLSLLNTFVTYQLFPLHIFTLSDLTLAENREKWQLTGIHNNWTHFTMDSLQARKECYEFYKKINNLPYHYLEESRFFNFRFTNEQRKKIFRLRKKLTIAIFEKAPDPVVQAIFKNIAFSLGLQPRVPGHEVIKQLTVQG
jgi:radical SAM superfamily enzyme YgiQ (UPF0313 family)